MMRLGRTPPSELPDRRPDCGCRRSWMPGFWEPSAPLGVSRPIHAGPSMSRPRRHPEQYHADARPGSRPRSCADGKRLRTGL